MRICSKCKRELPSSDFRKRPDAKDGVDRRCRQCLRKQNHAWRTKNINRLRADRHQKYLDQKDKFLKRASDKRKEPGYLTKFYAYRRNWYARNKQKFSERHSERWKNDLNYRMKMILRNRIGNALRTKNFGKRGSTLSFLGCSVEDFRLYIESKFEPGMSWDNFGQAWHIDHIIPCALFDLSKAEHQNACFHFSNMQPLFASANYSKGKRLIAPSDSRLKCNIIKVGQSPSGYPIFEFSYISDPYRRFQGTTAQALLDHGRADAVGQLGPYYTVNYKLIDIDLVDVTHRPKMTVLAA